jgi:lipopolysaccharide transport system permease protein
MPVFSDLWAVLTRWRTWFLMGSQDIDMRYRRSLLGPFWISLSMAALVVGLASIYGRLFDQEFHQFLYWLSCGFLAWFFISGMMNDGMQIAIEAEGQLRSVPIPLPVLAARMVHRNVVIFAHNALVIIAMMALFGLRPTLAVLEVIPGVLALTAVGFFSALVLGPICLRFRDVAQVVGNIIQIMFFLTPIMWKPDQGRVPEVVTQANPFFHLIELVRAPLLGNSPTLLNWEVSLSVLVTLTAFALLTLSLTRRKILIWL